MAKVIKSELVSSSIVSLLTNDIQDTTNLIEKLTNFGNDTTLKGADYEVAKKKALSYVEILGQRKAIASSLSSAILQAMSQFATFMGEYEELDDSEIGALETKLSQAQTNYSSLQSQLGTGSNNTENTNSSSTNSQTTSSNNTTNYDASSIRSQMASVDTIIKDVEKKLAKLRELASKDASLYGMISNCQEQVSSYSSNIGSIAVANIGASNVGSAL